MSTAAASPYPALVTRRVPAEEWEEAGTTRFGRNPSCWQYVCPSCRQVSNAPETTCCGAIGTYCPHCQWYLDMSSTPVLVDYGTHLKGTMDFAECSVKRTEIKGYARVLRYHHELVQRVEGGNGQENGGFSELVWADWVARLRQEIRQLWGNPDVCNWPPELGPTRRG